MSTYVKENVIKHYIIAEEMYLSKKEQKQSCNKIPEHFYQNIIMPLIHINAEPYFYNNYNITTTFNTCSSVLIY
jgi:hypothetical protein